MIDQPALAIGRYHFHATVSKPDGHDAVTPSVTISVETGTLPIVSIASMATRKPDPASKLALFGSAVLPPDSGSQQAAAQLAWSVFPADIELHAASTTGTSGLNLVLRESSLQPGATYTFTLRVTHLGKHAEATSTFTTNRPPWGGVLTLQFEAPAVALTTIVKMSATNWVDDLADLPLSFSFAARRAEPASGEPSSWSEGNSYTVLQQRSMSTSALWLPSEGNWTIVT